MVAVIDPRLLLLACGGVAAGLVLLGRGFVAYRRAGQIAGTATSTVASMAVGEVRVSGVVETAELSLVSPLQSAACVYYRSSIHESSGRDSRTILDEERAVGFRVRDATGAVRVFPNGARFDVPAQFAESSGLAGEAPPGLLLRTGPAIGMSELDRETQIAALLTVHAPSGPGDAGAGAGTWHFGGLGGLRIGSGALQYREARIEPGQVVTVVGQALPFDQIDDPAAADVGGSGEGAFGAGEDPEVAADLAAARAAGVALDAARAWGNAAIPGFGIGLPITPPELDPEAHRLPLGTARQAERARRTFEIAPGELVLAAAPEAPITIALGAPAAAVGRAEGEFLVGLLGAVLAIASAVALAVLLQGGLR